MEKGGEAEYNKKQGTERRNWIILSRCGSRGSEHMKKTNKKTERKNNLHILIS
jgi:hypothetical protein